MKKIISIILCAVILTCATIFSANAATVDDSSVGAHNFTVVDKSNITLGNGFARFYTYNFTDNNPKTGIRMVDTTKNTTNDIYFNDISGFKQVSVPQTSVIEHFILLNTGSTGSQSGKYAKTGGTYEKIRIKLSDYSSYFNSDGTHTKDGFNYNFSTQKSGNSTYSSALVIWSGGVFTAVTPNKDGYVEFYVSKNIGVDTRYFTSFGHKTPSSVGGGGGRNGAYLDYFTMGDPNFSGSVNINDVTAIQLYSAGEESFDNLQKRNADVNFDGKIDIDDATMIQKYIAGLL